MNLMNQLMDLVAELPELAVILVCPVLLLVCGVLFAVFGLKRVYPAVAVGLGGVALFLAASKNLSASFAYLGLYIAWAALVGLLFLIPPKKRGTSQEEMFQTFYRPLDLGEESESIPDETLDEEECSLRLSHTVELLEKLKKSDLNAGDRLEADALSKTLEGFSERELTPAEMRSLNDCLATVLKLTAKYKL